MSANCKRVEHRDSHAGPGFDNLKRRSVDAGSAPSSNWLRAATHNRADDTERERMLPRSRRRIDQAPTSGAAAVWGSSIDAAVENAKSRSTSCGGGPSLKGLPARVNANVHLQQYRRKIRPIEAVARVVCAGDPQSAPIAPHLFDFIVPAAAISSRNQA